MKAGQDLFSNKSSFLSVDKDYAVITKRILNNDKLCKLLYYTEKDCLKAANLTMEQKLSMVNKQIKFVPSIQIETNCPSQLVIMTDGFMTNKTNPEFRDCVVVFHILCHPDHWLLEDFALRPYKIAGEVDGLFNKAKLSGIGTFQFLGGDNLMLNSQAVGISLGYGAIHGIEDLKNPLA